jgi:hypothetical protein
MHINLVELYGESFYFPQLAAMLLQGLISGSHGGEYEMAAVWVVAPCSVAEVYRRFRGACFLLHAHRPDDGGSKHL